MLKWIDKLLAKRAEKMADADCVVFCHRPEVPAELKK
ncbi:cyclic lactone autoinducer peptide [Gorillibacterium sp. sgz5001074]